MLITGGSGRLGRELVKAFPRSIHPTHSQLDVTDREDVLRFLKMTSPDIVVHCAALTGIRECEEKRNLAWKTNVIGTENLVRGLERRRHDSYFVLVSTACVFHGDQGNYVETDIPYPKNFYSLTKMWSELVVQYSRLKRWLIVRTNFTAQEKWPYSRAFTDRYGTYLFANRVAGAMKKLVSQNMKGVVHICGDKRLSMFELAKLTTPDIQPMTMSDYVGPPLTIDMSLKSIRIPPIKLRVLD